MTLMSCPSCESHRDIQLPKVLKLDLFAVNHTQPTVQMVPKLCHIVSSFHR